MTVTVNIDEAKSNLSRLVDAAAKGESFIISKAGKALVKVVAVDAPVGMGKKKLGFLSDRITVPEDFDAMGRDEIEELFRTSE
ncbi:type II toxin-antitoxin system Phd/YefM family antitoxin [Jiella marina]|uniref:type II toxin-antitoxin system Phd/YefM family antitoxin n=1 Tax=Jiella sp. LLJ827 TaxID=2917712 RepID=UPI002101B055|nr:type II toxin-antitoxin system prevent-host-death family antitoxin [Jiella sp. LLJ827]MCQ0987443.1 type II toxin-antitoxin system prevent-host-death family antitoxin [Jiella sp. LLJ827]